MLCTHPHLLIQSQIHSTYAFNQQFLRLGLQLQKNISKMLFYSLRNNYINENIIENDRRPYFRNNHTFNFFSWEKFALWEFNVVLAKRNFQIIYSFMLDLFDQIITTAVYITWLSNYIGIHVHSSSDLPLCMFYFWEHHCFQKSFFLWKSIFSKIVGGLGWWYICWSLDHVGMQYLLS